ncbi:MAG: isoprenyl transferase [Bacteroidia bacterium]|jgi:undecaprenyl diphosphate synthase
MSESALKEKIDPARLPSHVAIIMDGNGRWAMQKGHLRMLGHQHGVQAVRNVTEAAAELGVKYVTLYAFSTENWRRPQEEINALMALLVDTIQSETDTLMKNGIRLEAIGNLAQLPPACNKQLQETVEVTKDNDRMTLILALSYSGRWDIIEATRKIARQVKEGLLQPDEIDENVLNSALNTSRYPNPELLIRTSGEQRISNFLLWEIAYAEMHFTPVLWPDFSKDDFYQALLDFQQRDRRFGLTAEQLHS